MKLRCKVQPYQTNAVESVVDCFAGQPMTSGLAYRIDPGRTAQVSAFDEGFKNADWPEQRDRLHGRFRPHCRDLPDTRRSIAFNAGSLRHVEQVRGMMRALVARACAEDGLVRDRSAYIPFYLLRNWLSVFSLVILDSPDGKSPVNHRKN